MVALVLLIQHVQEPLFDAKQNLGYAPGVVSFALQNFYAFAYAAAAAVAAWESGRLKRYGVWELAPVRSRARIAWDVLWPVWLLAWGTLLLPVLVALVHTGIAPTVACLPLLVMGIVEAMAYSVIGFAVGLVVPRHFSLPLLAGGVWFGVASSWSYSSPMWLRHVLGQYPATLMFGELPTFTSLATHVLFVGGIAAGLLLRLVPRSALRSLTALALVVPLAGVGTSWALARNWGANPTLTTGHAPVTCTHGAPVICMPSATDAGLPTARAGYGAVRSALVTAGVRFRQPEKITDSVLDGRFSPASAPGVWRVRLTGVTEPTALRFAFASRAAIPACEHPDRAAAQRIALWVGEVTHTFSPAYRREKGEAFTEPQQQDLARAVTDVRKLREEPAPAQAAWYARTVKLVCAGSTSGANG